MRPFFLAPICFLAPATQAMDSAMHRLYYLAGKYYGRQLRYPLDSDLSSG